MKSRMLTLIVLLIFMSGCATAPGRIRANYVSPIQYYAWTCGQIHSEMIRVSAKVASLSGTQQAECVKDTVALTVGLFLCWPALFFMLGDDQKQEIAQLKGEYDALERAAIHNECGFINLMEEEREEQLIKEQKEKEEKKTKRQRGIEL